MSEGPSQNLEQGMAVVVSTLLQMVIEKLASPILERCGLLWDIDEEMENLRSKLSTIQAVLEDVEEQQVKDKALQIWLGKLKDLASDADNILNEFPTEAKRRKVEISGRITKVCNFFSPSKINLGNKIKEIGQRLDEIAGERSKFHLR
ncbi:putative disease resistance protein RGA4 [Magnolia sinica]|uniref:putative disease resistance protein RGA4 n=1 Tax=Magnolia sinica TaxID=86752 RepID=UPI002659F077|nr:putative disease resistance protein RGA4 [Magnolia sinica]